MLISQKLRYLAAALACTSVLCTPLASAQSYPNKPITIVVGYSAGGGVDSLARSITEGLPMGGVNRVSTWAAAGVAGYRFR